MRARARAALLGGLLAAVSTGQEPAFDAASVKLVKPASHPVFGNSGGPGTGDPGRIHLCCVGMYSLLMRAYDAQLDRIVGPSWIMENMGPHLYQVDATMPPGTTKAQFQLMMRNLLRQRFHLEIHRESRNFPGYELVVAEGGPKLRESHPDSNPVVQEETPRIPKRSADGALILPPGPQMYTSLGRGMIIVQAQEKPVGELVKGLGRMIAQSLGEDPNDFASRKPRVVDKTGLTGRYDFTLRFSCEVCQFAVDNGTATSAPDGAEFATGLPDIFAALQSQLGLKLVKVKDILLDVIVVDRADQVPTAN